ncbi:hypothetical protein [uncultured Roseibium sp.]|uniref:hypothetical protein n=1 Tax=uncultured Roseibium sp. TaxID=1936171 RepID=UPI003217DDE9
MTAQAIQATEATTMREIAEDPWLMTAFGLGSVLTAFFFVAHACCFGADAAMLKSLSVICSSAG